MDFMFAGNSPDDISLDSTSAYRDVVLRSDCVRDEALRRNTLIGHHIQMPCSIEHVDKWKAIVAFKSPRAKSEKAQEQSTGDQNGINAEASESRTSGTSFIDESLAVSKIREEDSRDEIPVASSMPLHGTQFSSDLNGPVVSAKNDHNSNNAGNSGRMMSSKEHANSQIVSAQNDFNSIRTGKSGRTTSSKEHTSLAQTSHFSPIEKMFKQDSDFPYFFFEDLDGNFWGVSRYRSYVIPIAKSLTARISKNPTLCAEKLRQKNGRVCYADRVRPFFLHYQYNIVYEPNLDVYLRLSETSLLRQFLSQLDGDSRFSTLTTQDAANEEHIERRLFHKEWLSRAQADAQNLQWESLTPRLPGSLQYVECFTPVEKSDTFLFFRTASKRNICSERFRLAVLRSIVSRCRWCRLCVTV